MYASFIACARFVHYGRFNTPPTMTYFCYRMLCVRSAAHSIAFLLGESASEPSSQKVGWHWKLNRRTHMCVCKQVALTCIISLRQNNDGSSSPDSTSSSIGDDEDGDTTRGNGAAPPPSSAAAAAAAAKLPLNQGCERVIRFCSPNNVASTLTPAHFAQVWATLARQQQYLI